MCDKKKKRRICWLISWKLVSHSQTAFSSSWEWESPQVKKKKKKKRSGYVRLVGNGLRDLMKSGLPAFGLEYFEDSLCPIRVPSSRVSSPINYPGRSIFLTMLVLTLPSMGFRKEIWTLWVLHITSTVGWCLAQGWGIWLSAWSNPH